MNFHNFLIVNGKKKGYNLDVVFIHESIAVQRIKYIGKQVSDTQHRHILSKFMLAIKTQTIHLKRKYNFEKANWKSFSEDLAEKTKNLSLIVTNYDIFVNIVK